MHQPGIIKTNIINNRIQTMEHNKRRNMDDNINSHIRSNTNIPNHHNKIKINIMLIHHHNMHRSQHHKNVSYELCRYSLKDRKCPLRAPMKPTMRHHRHRHHRPHLKRDRTKPDRNHLTKNHLRPINQYHVPDHHLINSSNLNNSIPVRNQCHLEKYIVNSAVKHIFNSN